MFKKCFSVILTLALIATLYVSPAFGADEQVSVTIPNFPVTLNELKFDNLDYERYPLLVYKDITYFPMTFYQSNLLNLETNWTVGGGLVIAKGNPIMAKEFLYETPLTNRNSKTQTATIASSKITVNNKLTDNNGEQYPLLLFRDVTYFPLTWRFAVDEFGWGYSFDHSAGLIINTDNYFFIGDKGSGGFDDGGASINDAETHYFSGNLRVSIKTHADLGGWLYANLSITKNGSTISPDGYWGYFINEKGPLFSVDGGYINTTYLENNSDAKNTRPVKVSIETGLIN